MQTEHILFYIQLGAGAAMFPNVPDSPLSEAPELAEADVSAGFGSWESMMTTETINSCLSNNFDGMAIKGSGTQWPISTVDRSERSRSPQVRAQQSAHQVRAQQARPETQPKAAAATSGSFRSSWTQWPGYSRINIGGPMEEVFVPHWQKLWANWKGRHWSIRSIPDMHASDWKDEGPSVNPLGEDGASSVNPLGEDGAPPSSSSGKITHHPVHPSGKMKPSS